MHKTDLIWGGGAHGGGTANVWGGMCPPGPLGDATARTPIIIDAA